MHMTILGYIVVVETKKRTLALMSVGAVYLVYLFYLLTDYSSLTFFNWNYPIQGSYPINVHQYYDISTIINLGSLIIVFYWLYKLVYSNAIYSVQIKPKYLYIFAFLILYAGTFFILAFGRSLLIDPQNWQYLWGTIFLPIYVLFNILLFRGLLWK